jgi:hypothetical protein
MPDIGLCTNTGDCDSREMPGRLDAAEKRFAELETLSYKSLPSNQTEKPDSLPISLLFR